MNEHEVQVELLKARAEGVKPSDEVIKAAAPFVVAEAERVTAVPDIYLALADEMESVTKAAASKEPYGDVTYADPGYQDDGKKRYPLDTDAHIRAAWGYINQAKNEALYSAANYKTVRGKIKAAMDKIGADTEA